jgi:hypothetical protein
MTPSDDVAVGKASNATDAQSHFRRTLWRVMVMQVGALIVLWWLQSRYNG